MFRGVTALSLDAKGRLVIPSRYRDRLQVCCAGQLIVTVDTDRCLLMYPLPDWEQIERRLAALPNLDTQTRRLQRLLIGHATECEMDGNGRILLPQPLREFAMLDKQVMMIGQGSKFELWDQGRWNEHREDWLAADMDGRSLPIDLGSLSL
ncbi:MAG: division/cell wall cluster transcriptional repressor MraZ [Gammaproteobacteria bacterium]|nr:division/cell wall cluster transcriptional repressor MraZ [Gammaproteobacteria bacterium]